MKYVYHKTNKHITKMKKKIISQIVTRFHTKQFNGENNNKSNK